MDGGVLVVESEGVDTKLCQNRQEKETEEAFEKLLNEVSGTEQHPTVSNQRNPVDRCYVVYLIFIIHGVGMLMPWNMFITANDYFVYHKLRPWSNDTEFGNGNGDVGVKSVYQSYFLPALGFVASIPGVIINAVNVFSQRKGGSPVPRIVSSLIIVVIMFSITIVLAMVDTSHWQNGTFFWITMTSVVVINLANGIYQNSMFGVAACLPMKYMNAVIIGSNVSGILTAIIMISAIAGAPEVRTSAIYYFLAAVAILLIAFDFFYFLDLLPFYRHYTNRAKSSAEKAEKEPTKAVDDRPPFWKIFKESWVHQISAYFVFVVTLSIYPALQANTKKSNPNFFISDKYYGPLTCFLLFNVFAFLGNVVSSFVQKPGPRWAWLPILLRVLYIPFFVFCNVSPDTRKLPVLFHNEYVYIVVAMTMAFTSGYFSSLTMMYAPSSMKDPQHQTVAGMMGAFFLVLGILSGVTLSIPLTALINSVGDVGSGITNATNGIS